MSEKNKTSFCFNSKMLRVLRDKESYSRTDVVLKLHDLGCRTNHQSLGDYENGKVSPRIDSIIALAEVYKVDLRRFISRRVSL